MSAQDYPRSSATTITVHTDGARIEATLHRYPPGTQCPGEGWLKVYVDGAQFGSLTFSGVTAESVKRLGQRLVELADHMAAGNVALDPKEF